MATKSKVVEKSFRIGAGRFVQEDGCIKTVGDEVEFLKCSKPFIMGGTSALSITKNDIEESLKNKGITGYFYEFKGFCDPEHCQKIVNSEEFKNSDIVIGVGGGILMDASKLCAVLGDKPVILIPTSSATCASYAPLSVTYNNIGQPLGTKHHNREVNCVLCDMDILSKQPVRLFKSGVYDSLAKFMETKQRIIGKNEDEIDIGLRSSFELSRFLYDRLNEDFDKACLDIENKQNTKAVFDCVYLAIAVTGVVSGLARGSNQTAIAHKIYESARALFPEHASKYLHGEVVAVGLISQLYYNGEAENATLFANKMKERNMVISLNEMGIAHSEENLNKLYEKMLASSAMAGTTEEEHKQLFEALKLII